MKKLNYEKVMVFRALAAFYTVILLVTFVVLVTKTNPPSSFLMMAAMIFITLGVLIWADVLKMPTKGAVRNYEFNIPKNVQYVIETGNYTSRKMTEETVDREGDFILLPDKVFICFDSWWDKTTGKYWCLWDCYEAPHK